MKSLICVASVLSVLVAGRPGFRAGGGLRRR